MLDTPTMISLRPEISPYDNREYERSSYDKLDINLCQQMDAQVPTYNEQIAQPEVDGEKQEVASFFSLWRMQTRGRPCSRSDRLPKCLSMAGRMLEDPVALK